jgi:16S rRNA processing protein RimM
MSGHLVIGKIVSSHGVRGEMKIKSLSGEDTHFRSAEKLLVRTVFGGTARDRELKVVSVRGAQPNLIVAFEGISSPEEAQKYRGAQVLLDRSLAAPLAEGEYYFADLEGCDVFYGEEKRGTVKSVWENSNCDMLEVVLTDGQVVQVPLQDQFVDEVDTERKVIALRVDWILE